MAGPTGVPNTTGPVAADPVATDPVAEPVVGEPVVAVPVIDDPVTGRPVVGETVVVGGPLDDTDALAVLVAATVTAHPAVARLDGGVFGSVATYLPGRRLVGVRIPEGAELVELGVVLNLSARIPDVARDLRREVSALCGGAAVNITVTDLAIPAIAVGPPATA